MWRRKVTLPLHEIMQRPIEKDSVMVPVYQPRSADLIPAWISARALNSCVMLRF
jgi:hypothetical protein